MSQVVNIGEARKRRSEEGQVMHFAGPNARRNLACPNCRLCELCGGPARNDRRDGSGPAPDVWTDDYGVFAAHSHPCTRLKLIGEEDAS